MPRKSSITQLDPRIRAEIDRIINDGGYTIDGLVDALKALGGEASRSAVGRYAKNAEKRMEVRREAEALAKTWIGTFKADPNGDIGVLLTEMMRMLAFQQIDKRTDDNSTNTMDVALLSRALKDIAGTEKLTIERIEKIKKLTREEATEAVKAVAKREGVSPETMEKITAAIAGGG